MDHRRTLLEPRQISIAFRRALAVPLLDFPPSSRALPPNRRALPRQTTMDHHRQRRRSKNMRPFVIVILSSPRSHRHLPATPP